MKLEDIESTYTEDIAELNKKDMENFLFVINFYKRYPYIYTQEKGNVFRMVYGRIPGVFKNGEVFNIIFTVTL